MKGTKKKSERRSKSYRTMKQVHPMEETLLIRQRLRNLCELAIAIGQREGLLHSPLKASKKVTGSTPTTTKRPANRTQPKNKCRLNTQVKRQVEVFKSSTY